jgi:hypothetical protein
MQASVTGDLSTLSGHNFGAEAKAPPGDSQRLDDRVHAGQSRLGTALGKAAVGAFDLEANPVRYRRRVTRLELVPRSPAEHIDLDGELEFEPVTEPELVSLALADDPEREVSPDAVPLPLHPGLFSFGLPSSYMPPVAARSVRGWRVPAALTVVISLLLIEAFGMCITYGILVAA